MCLWLESCAVSKFEFTVCLSRSDPTLGRIIAAISRWQSKSASAPKPFGAFHVFLHAAPHRDWLFYSLLVAGGATVHRLLSRPLKSTAESKRKRSAFLQDVLQPAHSAGSASDVGPLTHALIDKSIFQSLYAPESAVKGTDMSESFVSERRAIIDWCQRNGIPIVDDQFIVEHLFQDPKDNSLSAHILRPPASASTTAASNSTSAISSDAQQPTKRKH